MRTTRSTLRPAHNKAAWKQTVSGSNANLLVLIHCLQLWSVWLLLQVSIRNLHSTMKRMAAIAGIDKKLTNHSARKHLVQKLGENYGGIFRTYILLFFISCARHFLFRRSFFLFYYLVRTTFYFVCRFFLFYYLVRTTFLFRRSFFFSIISCARLFYFVDRFFFSIISCARLFYFVDRFIFSIISCEPLIDLFSGVRCAFYYVK